jgi:hypothetical protein
MDSINGVDIKNGFIGTIGKTPADQKKFSKTIEILNYFYTAIASAREVE